MEQPDAPPSVAWTRLRRTIMSILVVAATSYGGVMLGTFIARLIAASAETEVLSLPIRWGLVSIGVTYVLASFEKVLNFANRFRQYIMQPEKSVSLYPDCVALACIFAYVTVAVQVKPPAEGPLSSIAGGEIVYLSRISAQAGGTLAAFPFLFDMAEADGTGKRLNQQQVADLSRLVASLLACVGDSTNQDVVIEVQGYADANEFPSNSDELNRQVANSRGSALHEALAGLLRTQSGVSKVVLMEYRGWPKEDPKAMTRGRYFTARKLKETGGRDQGLFNRRADILLHNLGVCERLARQ